jgi:hypothetical protein
LPLQYGVAAVEAKGKAPKEVKIIQFSSSGQSEGAVVVPMIVKTDAEWRRLLSPEAFEVTRRARTEYPTAASIGICMTKACIAVFEAKRHVSVQYEV